MNQALHIFKKDVAGLWREILLMSGVAANVAWLRPDFAADFFMCVTAGFLISRVIHAESIPGDKQFHLGLYFRIHHSRGLADANP